MKWSDLIKPFIAGSQVSGERSDEVMEIRDDGRSNLVCFTGGPLTVTGELSITNDIVDKHECKQIKFNLIYSCRLRGSMTSPTQPLYCMLTGFIICWAPRLSMGLD